ncbi:MAG: VOC family protein [Pseudomonadota bacterium]
MAIRSGYRQVSAYLINPKAPEIMAFAATVFGATPVHPPLIDEGRLAHVALAIGDSVVLIGEPRDGFATETAFLHIYAEDVDATYEKALAAGATSVMPPAPQPHGDRAAMVRDTGGNSWWIACFVENLDGVEILKRLAAVRA